VWAWRNDPGPMGPIPDHVMHEMRRRAIIFYLVLLGAIAVLVIAQRGKMFLEWPMAIVLAITLVVFGRELQTHWVCHRKAIAEATPEQLSLWDRELDS